MSGEFTVASFNAHWGVGRFGAQAGVRFDVAQVVRGFDADVIVVEESWRHRDGIGVLDALRADGYAVESLPMLNLRLRGHGHASPADPGHGMWELAFCSRFPVLEQRKLPIGIVTRDPVRLRHAFACTLDVAGSPVEVIGYHASSKLWYGGPVRHLLALRRQLPGRDRPAVLAGDFNLWGPAGRARCCPGGGAPCADVRTRRTCRTVRSITYS